MKLASSLLPLLVGGAALTLAATSSALAQPPAGGPPPHGSPLVRLLDADHDHTITASEIAGAAAALKALDTDGDGIVSAEELRPKPPAGAPQPPADLPPPPAAGERPPCPDDPLMLALDANSDGALSAAEIANASTSLLALDANKDGALTPEEFAPLPPEGAPTNP